MRGVPIGRQALHFLEQPHIAGRLVPAPDEGPSRGILSAADFSGSKCNTQEDDAVGSASRKANA